MERDLHSALTESAEERARILLATGEIPTQASAPTAEHRTKELISKQRTLEAAIRLQERSVEEVRPVLAGEVIQHLRPAMGNTVQRIAEGYDAARAATADADYIRYAFSQIPGAEEVLPCFVFRAVPAPTNVKDEFEFWLDDMRQQGYEV